MANGVFNISKGRVVEKIANNPSALEVILLTVAEADDTLDNYTDMAALLASAGNTEATFTNYARKTGIIGTITVDNTANTVSVDFPDQTWASAGGTTNNTMVKAIIAYQTGANDGTLIPLTHHDWAPVTDGSDLTLKVDPTGFFQAA